MSLTRKIWEEIYSYFELTMMIVAGFLFLFAFGPILQAMAPVVTFLLVAGLTFATFANGKSTLASIIGLIIFGVSFPAVEVIGTIPALFVWFTGIITWGWGVFNAFSQSRGDA